jgi:hypothetical protein
MVLLLAALGGLLVETAAAQLPAKPVALDARITDVTVFPWSANVTRTAVLEGEPAEYQISLKALPVQFQRGSLSARTEGEAKVLDVLVDEKRVTKLSDEARQARRDELEKLGGELDVLRDRRRATDARISFLDDLRGAWSGVRKVAGSQEAAAITVAQAAEALKFLEQYDELYTIHRELNSQTAKLMLRQAQLKTELSEAEKGETVNEFRPVIRVAKFGRLPVQLLVEYRVGEAGWAADYDLRAQDSKAEKVELLYYAELHQRSGEEWPAVRLTFSTAAPSAGLEIPQLEPLYVSQHKEAVPIVAEAAVGFTSRFNPPGFDAGSFLKGVGGGGGAAASLFAATAPAEQEKQEKKAVEERKEQYRYSEQAAETYATFTAAGAQTIPSDDSTRRVMVTSAALGASPRLIAVPRLSDKVYLTAEMKNDSGLPLLEGSAKVYVGNDYLGEMHVPAVAAGETFSAAFGGLSGFKVSRKKLTMTDTTAGLFQNRRRVEYQMQIRLENLSQEPRQVEVQEALPISQQKEISIKSSGTPDKEATHESAKRLREDNVRTWLVTVQPGAEKAEVVKYNYSVEWDKDKFLDGALD